MNKIFLAKIKFDLAASSFIHLKNSLIYQHQVFIIQT